MKQRSLILIPFPFSDQSGLKVRPGLIVSNDKFNKASEDVIVCAVTSNIEKSKNTILIEQKDLENGTLYQKSAIKAESILKVNKSIIIKNIGTIKSDVLSEVIESVKSILEP